MRLFADFAYLAHVHVWQNIIQVKSSMLLRASIFRSGGIRRDDLGLGLPLKAGATQHGSALPGHEWNGGGDSAPRAGNVCLPDGFGAMLLGLTSLAVLWVLCELFLVEEKLFSSRKNELGIAVNAH